MIRIFKHYVALPLLILGSIEFIVLVVAIYLGVFVRYDNTAFQASFVSSFGPESLTFAGVFFATMFALGLYERENSRDLHIVFVRLTSSFGIAFLILALVYYVLPDLRIWRGAFGIAALTALAMIIGLRFAFLRVCDLSAFKRAILVLGAAEQARRIERLEMANGGAHGFTCMGFVPIGEGRILVDPKRLITGVNALADFALERGIEEIVVAVRDRRAGLPVEALLDCKLEGMTVTDYSSFWERETGRVDLDVMYPSWLIYSDGFGGGRLRTVGKRLFDVVFSILMLILALPMLVLAALTVRLESPGPVFYRQERVGLNGHPFMLFKFRSMRADAEGDGKPKWAAVNDDRVTRCGAFLRRTRIDEIPQIVNVLRGDMSFVGPRPERPFFVDKLGHELPYYKDRHRVKPGITGWAQLNYP